MTKHTLQQNPLVSIIVVTYNSSQTVVETLESMREQSYQNLELIVSDDYSLDDTVAICEKWLKENNERFVRTELVTASKNTGISQNFNRGLAAATGDWIKTIAGDDALFSYTIEEYIKYTLTNSDVKFLHSNIASYNDTLEEKNIRSIGDSSEYKINHKDITAEEQYQILLRKCRVRAPTVMIKREVFDLVGNFNESYPLWEDRPMWLKITKHNIKLQYLNIIGAKYRVSSSSIQTKKDNGKLIPDYIIQRDKAYLKEILPKLPYLERVIKGYLILRVLFLDKNNMNKKNFFTKTYLALTGFPFKTISNKINQKYY